VFEEEKSPNITDYLASATLSYGITFLWFKLSTMMEIPWFFAYLFFYTAGLGPSYLICQQTTRNQFPVAMISAVFSWIFTIVCLITFTQGDPMAFFKMLLVLYLLGGLTSAIITMRDRLRPKKSDES
jgi:tryptophan-rich sensory protein